VAAGGPFRFVFAVSPVGLSTPAVFAATDDRRATLGETVTSDERPPPELPPALLAALSRGDVAALVGLLHNDLEAAALDLQPELRETLRVGTAAGALAATVSGSGATCAFLVSDATAADRVAAHLRRSGICSDVRVAHGPVPGPGPVSVREPA
jgi:4-diphosphocytidyl-2-C-methyl-D-erythritol kinase